jgi:hypothetical protein
MNSKTLPLLSLGIFVVVLFAGLINAATLAEWSLTSDGVASNVHTNINAGDFTGGVGISDITFGLNGAYADLWTLNDSVDAEDYFQITLSPKAGYDLRVSALNFGERRSLTGITNYEVQWSKSSDFSSPTTIATEIVPDDDAERDGSITGLSISVNEGETIYFRWFGYGAEGDSGTWRINDGTLNIEGSVTEIEPDWTSNFCIYDDGAAENQGDLRVKIKDIKVVEGFGDDTEWLPFDEIEVEVEVENKGDEDVDDVVVEWGFYDEDAEEWVIEVDDEDEFNVKDGDEEKLTFTFDIDDDMDVDLEDLEDGKHYVLYVRATGEIDGGDYDGDDTCEWDKEEIEMIIEKDFIVLSNFDYPDMISCGSELRIGADVWNVGSKDQDDVLVKILNKELDIVEEVKVGDIDSFENEDFDVLIKIPENAHEKTYTFVLEVLDEDGDVYESDYDDEQAKFDIPIKVEGSCGEVPTGINAVVSAVLESGGRAGEPLVVRATLTNTGVSTATFMLNAAGYSEWAETADVDPARYTLDKTESGEILFTFDVMKDVEGDQLFTIEVVSENQLVVEQPVSITIERAGARGISDIFGENWYLWLIGLLNVILVIIIIIVAVRVAKR